MSGFRIQLELMREAVESGKTLSLAELAYASKERVEQYKADLAQAKADAKAAKVYPTLTGEALTYWRAAQNAFSIHKRPQPEQPRPSAELAAKAIAKGKMPPLPTAKQWATYNRKLREWKEAAEAAAEIWPEVPDADHRFFRIWHPWNAEHEHQSSGDRSWDDMEFPLPRLMTDFEREQQSHLLNPERHYQLELLDEALERLKPPLEQVTQAQQRADAAERLARARGRVRED